MAYGLTNLSISNFRSCKTVSVPLAGVTPLIGYNNAGKSNVLAACKWFVAPFSLQEADFSDVQKPVEISGTISGVNAETLESLDTGHRRKIEPYIQDDAIQFRRVQSEPGIGVKQIELAIWNPESRSWDANPAGIAAAFSALFPDPIPIGAMEVAADEIAKAKASNTIGKLLAKLLAPVEVAHATAFRKSLQDVRDALGADGSARLEALQEFDRKASSLVEEFFPGIGVRVEVPLPDLRDLMKAGTIRVYEEGTAGRDLTSLGHGAQRCVQMALVRMLAESAASTSGRTVLLIDEPELYLHPQAIEQLRSSLRRLSSAGYQIIYSTHSPLMLDEQAFRDVVLIRKTGSDGTTRRKSLPDAIKACAEDNAHQSELLFSLSNASNVLFSESVVVAEGKTERAILPALVERVCGRSFGAARVALVVVEGSNSIPGVCRVLDALDLPARVVADLDFVFQKHKEIPLSAVARADLDSCRAHLKLMASEGVFELDDNGLPKKGISQSAADGYRAFAADHRTAKWIDSLVDELRKAGIWVWRRGTIEDHLGVKTKSTGEWAALLERVRTHGLDHTVADPVGIRNAIAWMVGTAK